MKTLTARNMVELKQKLREYMGWPDRRTWTAIERKALRARFDLSVDHSKGFFVARENPRTEPDQSRESRA